MAAAIGYPVMLKAAAGGGGRGIRRVDGEAELAEAFERCAGEAAAAFGDGTLFVEQLIDRPRHIEVQILADAAGNVVHLYDRDCSVQLRNQKVVEVAPATGLPDALRQPASSTAPSPSPTAAGYANAGTVEFLVSPEHESFAFIELNPRIQVEHTVTEEVMGVDLVEAQFRIAGGATLADLGLADQVGVDAAGRRRAGPRRRHRRRDARRLPRAVRSRACASTAAGYAGYVAAAAVRPAAGQGDRHRRSAATSPTPSTAPAAPSRSCSSPGCRRTGPSCWRSSPGRRCAPRDARTTLLGRGARAGRTTSTSPVAELDVSRR